MIHPAYRQSRRRIARRSEWRSRCSCNESYENLRSAIGIVSITSASFASISASSARFAAATARAAASSARSIAAAATSSASCASSAASARRSPSVEIVPLRILKVVPFFGPALP